VTNEKKVTIGQLQKENRGKDPGTNNAMELAGEMAKSFEEDLFEAVDRGLKENYPLPDFCVVIISPEEPGLDHVLRDRFFTRMSVPTPDLNQTVYLYHKLSDSLEFLWSVPDKDTLYYLLKNRKMLGPEDYFLLKQCMDFADGELYVKALQLNDKQREDFLNMKAV
jgi:hypothetical protein